ncbi:MAG: Mur ligase family protein [Patescibacteria group bacterium]
MFKSLIKKILPKFLILGYHRFLAYLAMIIYQWPSRKMIVIGVTGTAGKSTVVNLIGRILEEAGYKVGWTSTLNFKIDQREWLNTTKMTMLGRFALQKILRQMLEAGCQYAVIETSSEGIVQSRHLGIDYDLAIFTNLAPEHIESHGSFEKYRSSKGKLFAKLMKQKPKIINHQRIKRAIIVNLDDNNADYFLQFPAEEYYGFTFSETDRQMHLSGANKINVIRARNIKLNQDGSGFMVQNSKFKVNLLGEFNVYNSLAAITVALSQNVGLAVCQKALEKVKNIPGRLEIVINKPIKVIVDYAHTPDSLEKVYQLISKIKSSTSKIIAVLGSAGGGRDKWKRPKMGEIASEYADEVIVTNEDPYDENPEEIIEQVASGVSDKNVYKILDRGQAIKKAISLAKPGDLVIITGKGCEQCIMGPGGKKIPWDDRRVVREILKE